MMAVIEKGNCYQPCFHFKFAACVLYAFKQRPGICASISKEGEHDKS